LFAGGGQYLQRLITSSPVAFSDWFRAFHVSLFLLPLGMAALLKRVQFSSSSFFFCFLL
jgi:hypothetical protein